MFSFADPEFWSMGSAKWIYRAISYLTNFRRHVHTGLRSRFLNYLHIFFYSCYRHENVHNFTEKLIRPESLNEHYYYISQWGISINGFWSGMLPNNWFIYIKNICINRLTCIILFTLKTNSSVRYFLNQRKLYDGTTGGFIVTPQ